MKTSLWVVIAAVSGIVGFLMGYSVSSYTGVRAMEKLQAEEDLGKTAAAPPSAPGGTEAGAVATTATAAEQPAPAPDAAPAVPAKAGGPAATAPAAPKKPAKPAATSGQAEPAKKPASTGGY